MAPPTNPTVGGQLLDLNLRLTTLEVESRKNHEAVMLALGTQATALATLGRDLSEQGRTPIPAPAEPATWKFQLAPGTGTEIAKLLAVVIPVLFGVWGVAYTGAQSGGNSGATTAVETAVEQAEAIPVSSPAPVRVVPVPIPIPVPIPVEVEPPKPSASELMPFEVQP